MSRRASLRPDAGMTLVEVLMVVFIAGLVAGVAVLTLPDHESPQEKAVREVRQAVQDARDRALMTGEVLGLAVSDDGVAVERWTGEAWQPAGQTIRLGDGIRLSVRPAEGRQRLDEREETSRLVFNPLGVTDPVLIEIGAGAQRATLRLTPDGEVVDAGQG